MKALVHSGLVLACLALAAPADAQLGRALDDPGAPAQRDADEPREASSPSDEPSLGRALGDPDRVLEREAPPPPRAEPEAPWPGPQIQLGYSFYRISDGHGGGDVHAGGAEIFVQLPIPELRVGLLAEVGARDYALGGDDLVVRGALELGFQLAHMLDPFVPHVSLLVSFGGVVAERFESTVAHAFGGAGLALGGELRVARNLHLGAQASYQRLEMDGAAYDVVMIRLFAGL